MFSNVDCEFVIFDSKFILINNEIRMLFFDGIDYEVLVDVNFVYVL